jgi:hypothetical protein
VSDDLNPEHAPRLSVEGLGPNAGGVYILDNGDIVDGRPNPQLRLIGTALHGGWHSPVQAKIGGIPYLVSAGELGACPGAWPKIIDIADEKHPYTASAVFRAKKISSRRVGCAQAIGQRVSSRMHLVRGTCHDVL